MTGSKQLLQNLGISNVSVSGDTRFDRVWANARHPKSFPAIESFISGRKTFIAGSTWPEDDELLAKLVAGRPDWNFILAPHEISKEKVSRLMALLPPGSALRLSELSADTALQTLVIDNIGMLSSLYQYGDIAYIGGGFGAGIHNTLEAAAFGLPVIFGPNYSKFKEAKDLVGLQLGFSIKDEKELMEIFNFLIENELRYEVICTKITEYVKEHTGATEMIIKSL